MKYAVIDLEMCKVPKSLRCKEYRRSQETIQIGAVLLDENYEVVDKFNTYVCPEYGQIDSFINKLTGIGKGDLIGAPVMKDALESFIEWLPEDAVCVSWSNSDDSQIKYELEAKGIEIDRFGELFETWMDCQKTFGNKMNAQNGRAYGLEEALIAADIIPEGTAHDGLSDAYNTAQLFAKLCKNPDFELNSYYCQAREESVQHLTMSLGDFFSNLNFQCVVA